MRGFIFAVWCGVTCLFTQIFLMYRIDYWKGKSQRISNYTPVELLSNLSPDLLGFAICIGSLLLACLFAGGRLRLPSINRKLVGSFGVVFFALLLLFIPVFMNWAACGGIDAITQAFESKRNAGFIISSVLGCVLSIAGIITSAVCGFSESKK